MVVDKRDDQVSERKNGVKVLNLQGRRVGVFVAEQICRNTQVLPSIPEVMESSSSFEENNWVTISDEVSSENNWVSMSDEVTSEINNLKTEYQL